MERPNSIGRTARQAPPPVAAMARLAAAGLALSIAAVAVGLSGAGPDPRLPAAIAHALVIAVPIAAGLCPLRATRLGGPLRPAVDPERLSVGADHVRGVRRQPAVQPGPDLGLARGGPARDFVFAYPSGRWWPAWTSFWCASRHSPSPLCYCRRWRSWTSFRSEPVEQLRHRVSVQRPEHLVGAGVHRPVRHSPPADHDRAGIRVCGAGTGVPPRWGTRLTRVGLLPVVAVAILRMAMAAAFIVARRRSPDSELTDVLGVIALLCIPAFAGGLRTRAPSRPAGRRAGALQARYALRKQAEDGGARCHRRRGGRSFARGGVLAHRGSGRSAE